MAKSKHYYIRKAHRYLGVILGIQFLLWTIGGLYFSWSDMDQVHGDHQKKEVPLLPSSITLVSPSVVLDNINMVHRIDSIVSIQLIDVLGKPYYQVRCISAIGQNKQTGHHAGAMNHLADAVTGAIRGPLSKNEAIALAQSRFDGKPEVESVQRLTTVGKHHEYREGPLPAYAVRFRHPSRTTVYVAAELGTVQKFRNKEWRIFDFLWMLHTMDYEGRDNIGNWLLRIFSIFGLITVFSGFVLYFISSRRFKRRSTLK
ncbi:PepSY domain-containing protein [Flavihumibacter rivuli]|uniref:PepSY domain-containing protein n=1 Tax=Flavihumibacter rivuli TaxID=2838156 RepID=UPI001BDF6276|nr:PepSY domain-containing protein [Flavihumibacter rivuli]ULQ58238.1 PepSY domain-containing protein [Flavihumibacter rivuli]